MKYTKIIHKEEGIDNGSHRKILSSVFKFSLLQKTAAVYSPVQKVHFICFYG